jgi:hypothetical protein
LSTIAGISLNLKLQRRCQRKQLTLSISHERAEDEIKVRFALVVDCVFVPESITRAITDAGSLVRK